MRRALIAAALALAALAAYMASNLVPQSGAFATLDQKLVDQCTRIDVFPGTEDITIDPATSLAYVSAADRRAASAGRPLRGGVFAIDLANGYAVANVTPAAPADFQPHGISLWSGPGGDKRLFVINHPAAGGHTVEIFGIDAGGALAHLETVAFEAMHSPNDVVAVGPRQFYATNDRGFESGPMATLEAYLALPFSSAVYFDGETGTVIKKGLVYANGINISADGTTLYISEFLKRRIAVFARDIDSGALRKSRSVAVNTNPDNIEIARDGALWVAGHSRVFDLLKHVNDPSAIAPSHVVRISPRTWEVTDMFIDTTGKLNASSVGAVWDKTLLVGAVFDGHVMACPMLEIFLRSPAADEA